MSDERDCAKCGERFFRGTSKRRVCGVCWPVDLKNPIDWAAVLEAVRTRTVVGAPERFHNMDGRDEAREEKGTP